MSYGKFSQEPTNSFHPHHRNGDGVTERGTCFMTACSTCGRRLHVGVKSLGAVVTCPHCGRCFQAVETTRSAKQADDPLLARANRLLDLMEETGRPHLPTGELSWL